MRSLWLEWKRQACEDESYMPWESDLLNSFTQTLNVVAKPVPVQ